MVDEENKNTSQNRVKSLKDVKMVPIPERIRVPPQIPASKLRIPSTYAEGDVDYEDDDGQNVNFEDATHLRLTAKDNRSDLTVGPAEKNGMFKLNVYVNDENKAVQKDLATKRREVILNENYRPIRR